MTADDAEEMITDDAEKIAAVDDVICSSIRAQFTTLQESCCNSDN